MNEETIDYRLTQIETKLSQITDLLLQTQAQEMRLTTAEKAIQELKDNSKKSVERWLNPIVSAIVSGIIAFIFIKVGLK